MFRRLFTRPGPYSRGMHGWFAVMHLVMALIYGYLLFTEFLPTSMYIIMDAKLPMFLRACAILYPLFGIAMLAIFVTGACVLGWIALVVMRPKKLRGVLVYTDEAGNVTHVGTVGRGRKQRPEKASGLGTIHVTTEKDEGKNG